MVLKKSIFETTIMARETPPPPPPSWQMPLEISILFLSPSLMRHNLQIYKRKCIQGA